MPYDISQTYDGKWRTPPRKHFYRACCDCGLVHREEYRMKGGKIQYRVWRDKKETRRERRRLIDDIKVFGEIDDPRWPDPTPEMLSSPEFEAVWQCIKLWDINVPDAYVGYCGSNGNHVRAILDALRALPTTDLEKELLAALKNLIDHSGHMSPFGGDGATVKTMRNAMKYMKTLDAAQALIASVEARAAPSGSDADAVRALEDKP